MKAKSKAQRLSFLCPIDASKDRFAEELGFFIHLSWAILPSLRKLTAASLRKALSFAINLGLNESVQAVHVHILSTTSLHVCRSYSLVLSVSSYMYNINIKLNVRDVHDVTLTQFFGSSFA